MSTFLKNWEMMKIAKSYDESPLHENTSFGNRKTVIIPSFRDKSAKFCRKYCFHSFSLFWKLFRTVLPKQFFKHNSETTKDFFLRFSDFSHSLLLRFNEYFPQKLGNDESPLHENTIFGNRRTVIIPLSSGEICKILSKILCFHSFSLFGNCFSNSAPQAVFRA